MRKKDVEEVAVDEFGDFGEYVMFNIDAATLQFDVHHGLNYLHHLPVYFFPLC